MSLSRASNTKSAYCRLVGINLTEEQSSQEKKQMQSLVRNLKAAIRKCLCMTRAGDALLQRLESSNYRVFGVDYTDFCIAIPKGASSECFENLISIQNSVLFTPHVRVVAR